jgi:hypothetical protein
MSPHRRILRFARLPNLRLELLLLSKKTTELRFGDFHVATLTTTQTLATLPRTNMHLANPFVLYARRTFFNHDCAERIDKITKTVTTESTGATRSRWHDEKLGNQTKHVYKWSGDSLIKNEGTTTRDSGTSHKREGG